MTTIEEIENEIAALKEAAEIIEERTGNQFNNDRLRHVINLSITYLSAKLQSCIMDLPTHPYEPEYEHEDKWNH